MRVSRGSERVGAARQYLAAHYHSPLITPSDMPPTIGNCACFPTKLPPENPPPIRASASEGHTQGQTVVDKLNQVAAAGRSFLIAKPPPVR
jgi:hypothetical protein